MIVNINQKGIILVLYRDNHIYKLKGFKHVLIYRKDKKRTFTCITSAIKIPQVLVNQSV